MNANTFKPEWPFSKSALPAVLIILGIAVDAGGLTFDTRCSTGSIAAEFTAFIVGLALVAGGLYALIARLRPHSTPPRWRLIVLCVLIAAVPSAAFAGVGASLTNDYCSARAVAVWSLQG